MKEIKPPVAGTIHEATVKTGARLGGGSGADESGAGMSVNHTFLETLSSSKIFRKESRAAARNALFSHSAPRAPSRTHSQHSHVVF
jgi:hypothetical protein